MTILRWVKLLFGFRKKNKKYNLKTIIENLPDYVYWKDCDSVYQGGNWNIARAAGVESPRDIVGLTDNDFGWEKERVQQLIQQDHRILSTGESFIVEEEIPLYRNNKESVMQTQKVPMKDCNGEIIGILGISTDVTEMKVLQQKLVESRAREEKALRLVIENLPEYIYWKDKDCSYRGCNYNVSNSLGLSSPDEIIGKNDSDFGWSDERVVKLREIDNQILETGVSSAVEELIPDVEGNLRAMFSSKKRLCDHKGEVFGILGISVDLTKIKKIEASLKEAKAGEARFRAMSAIGAMIAHELRTPLASLGLSAVNIQKLLPDLISGYEFSVAAGHISSIRPDRLEALKHSAQRMERSINYAQSTINTVLQSFHYSDESTKIKMLPFSFNELLQSSIEQYPFDVDKIHLVSVEPFEEVQIVGDQELVIHVIHNLLKNALHAIEEVGQGSIKIWGRRQENNFYFYVKDTAKGISPESLPHVFEAFYTTKEKSAASIGIGLYFCKMALQKMNADISCVSELGQYTQFKMVIPLVNNEQ